MGNLNSQKEVEEKFLKKKWRRIKDHWNVGLWKEDQVVSFLYLCDVHSRNYPEQEKGKEVLFVESPLRSASR